VPRLLIAGSLGLLLASCGALLDSDGDGHPDGLDCAPEDPEVHPGVERDPFGDGVDQDCDGADGIDRDGDGFPRNTPVGHPERDCDDGDWRVHPGAQEFVGDLLDMDCDGEDS
jgi:hypothetical protein